MFSHTHRSNHEKVMNSIMGVPSRQRAGRSGHHFACAKSIAALFVNYLVIKLDKIIIKIQIAGRPEGCEISSFANEVPGTS